MKILYFYQYFGTTEGGWSTRVYEFARRWVQAGHEVTVITSPYDKSDIKSTNGLIKKHSIEGINVIVINFSQSNQHSKLRRIYTFLMYSFLSSYFALRLKSDVLISSSGPITIGIPGLIGKWLRGKKLIFEVRDLWPEGAIQLNILTHPLVQRLAYWFEKKCYLNANAIVTCSVGMSDSIRKRFGLNTVTEIPNSSDNYLFQSRDKNFSLPEWAVNKKLLIYTGSLGLMDQCMQLVNCAKILQDRQRTDIHIVVIGTGSDFETLNTWSSDQRLHNINFLGLLPKKEVVKWLHHAYAALLVFKDLRVLDTSSPNKFFDYLAASLPVVQTTQGWIKELLTAHKCGINVAPNNAIQMAEAIIYLADHADERERMGAKAKQLAESHFDRDKLSTDYLKIIENVSLS